MRKDSILPITIYIARYLLWALFILLIIPSENLYAQDVDDVDDIEEFFGDEDDDEYMTTKMSIWMTRNMRMTKNMRMKNTKMTKNSRRKKTLMRC